MDWLRDQVSVSFPDSAIGSLNTLTTITCTTGSSVGAPVERFRWRIEDALETRIVETNTPSLDYSFGRVGEYQVSVEATDRLGHRAVANGSIRILSAGSSTLASWPAQALTGGGIRYNVTLRNTSGEALPLSLVLPVPELTSYLSHTGGEFSGGALLWNGVLQPDSSYSLEFWVNVSTADSDGRSVVAEALIETAEGNLTLSATTPLRDGLYVPLIVDGSTGEQ